MQCYAYVLRVTKDADSRILTRLSKVVSCA